MPITTVASERDYLEYRVSRSFTRTDLAVVLDRTGLVGTPMRVLLDLRGARLSEEVLVALVEAVDGPDHGHRPDIAVLVDDGLPFDARLLGPAPDGRARHVRAFTDREMALTWLGVPDPADEDRSVQRQ